MTGDGDGAFPSPIDASRCEGCHPRIVAKLRARRYRLVCYADPPAALQTADTTEGANESAGSAGTVRVLPISPAIPNRKPVTLATLFCQDRNGLRQELSNPTWRCWVGRSALFPLLNPITCQTRSEATRHIFFSTCGKERSRRMKRQNDAKTKHGINLNSIFIMFATHKDHDGLAARRRLPFGHRVGGTWTCCESLASS